MKLESCDAKDMMAHHHSGFSVNAGVCIDVLANAAGLDSVSGLLIL